MNYQNVYNSLISHRKSVVPSGYAERHHIIPKSLGGDNSTENLVYLTAREHFVAHLILAKIHGGKMWAALFLMSHKKTKSAKDVKCSSRIYAIAKEKYSEWQRERKTGELNNFYGKSHTRKTKDLISKNHARLSGQNNPCFGRSHTEEERKRMSVKRPSNTGERHTLYGVDRGIDFKWLVSMVRSYKPNDVVINFEVRDRINKINGIELGVSNKGERQTRSKEILKLASYFGSMSKEKVVVTCPHCLKTGIESGMKRWHFERCKSK